MAAGSIILLLGTLAAEPSEAPGAPAPVCVKPTAAPPRTVPERRPSEDSRCQPIVVRCETTTTPARSQGGGPTAAGPFTDTLSPAPVPNPTVAAAPTPPAPPPPSPPSVAPALGPAHSPAAAPVGPLAITRLYVNKKPVDGARAELALGENLEIEVDGVSSLVKVALEKSLPIGLFLDGEFLKGVVGHNPPGTSLVSFTLNRTAENKEVWSKALGRPGISAREARLAVGFEDRSMITTQGSWTLQVSLFHTWINFLLFIPIAIIILSAFYFGRRTSLLRDFSPGHTPNVLPPYSLGKTQMAAWFANIAVAYLFIWAATSTLDALNTSLLILMGIGSATAFGATFLEKQKDAELGADGDGKPPVPQTSRGFLADLLSDAGGYSLPRLQIVGWTCILILVFWANVFRDLAMPDFSEAVLALMGVSSGTYLGFKLQAKKATGPVAPLGSAPSSPAVDSTPPVAGAHV